MDILQRDYLPENLHPHLQAHGIEACIAVQARASKTETDFLLELANNYDWIAGVIGWVDLSASDAKRGMGHWSDAKLLGFRHQLQDEANVGAMVRSTAFQASVARLQAEKKIYEILVYAHQLDSAIQLCSINDRHFLILDHLGKPSIRTGTFAAWYHQLQSLGSMPHVFCKLSGLVTEAADDGNGYDVSEIHRYLDAALEIFGPQRLMFGSDWPVCLLAASYAAVHELITRWADPLSDAEKNYLFGGTAIRCYGLT